jgi:hypothetical protein
LAALLAAAPFAAGGLDRVSAKRKGHRGRVKGEDKKKKKAIAGPAGPQGPGGAQGAQGPKAITSALSAFKKVCDAANAAGPHPCAAPCGTGEIAISGGFSGLTTGLTVVQSEKDGDSWKVSVLNTSGAAREFVAHVYCLPA